MSDHPTREKSTEAPDTDGPPSGDPPENDGAARGEPDKKGRGGETSAPEDAEGGADKDADKDTDGATDAESDAEADSEEDQDEDGEQEADEDSAEESEGEEEEEEEDEPRREVTLRLFGRTDVGQVREHNEDNFIVADLTKASRGLMEAERTQVVGDRGALLGVCDGMGGAAAGEVASQLAVDIIYQRMLAGDPPENHDELAARLVHAIEAAGLRIFSEAKLDRTRRGMGTTSTIAALMDDHLFLGQVGDSRGYILRGDRLVQVTRDQSLVNQLIEAGQLTPEEAETFEHNNIILQALGTSDSVQVDLTYVRLFQEDTLLLCSDGLSGMVRNDEIGEILRTVDDPLEACKVLTDRANQAGGHDNITVVVAKFAGDGLPAPDLEDVQLLRYQKYQLPEHLLAASSPEPARRVRDMEDKKISQRPPVPKSWGLGPDIEIRDDQDDYDDFDDEDPDDDDRGLDGEASGDEPIHIPTDGAPQWLVIMMIASAVACVTIAAYYLLR